jgi:hypothetical protein
MDSVPNNPPQEQNPRENHTVYIVSDPKKRPHKKFVIILLILGTAFFVFSASTYGYLTLKKKKNSDLNTVSSIEYGNFPGPAPVADLSTYFEEETELFATPTTPNANTNTNSADSLDSFEDEFINIDDEFVDFGLDDLIL